MRSFQNDKYKPLFLPGMLQFEVAKTRNNQLTDPCYYHLIGGGCHYIHMKLLQFLSYLWR
jgi:hypothetical protein